MLQEPSERQRSTGPLLAQAQAAARPGGAHTGMPPQEDASGARSSTMFPAALQSPELGRQGRAQLGLHQSFLASPDPTGTKQFLFPLGLSEPVRVCPHLLHKSRGRGWASTLPTHMRRPQQGAGGPQGLQLRQRARSGRPLLHLSSGAHRAHCTQRQDSATAAKRQRAPHPRHSEPQNCQTRLSRCHHSSPNVHETRLGPGHGGCKGRGSWVTSLKPEDDQNRRHNFQG